MSMYRHGGFPRNQTQLRQFHVELKYILVDFDSLTIMPFCELL